MHGVISPRENAKAMRRTRIVEAARALIGETGELGFSMRALAERSRVSLATPYNLFGSKNAIIVQLFNADLEDFEQRVAALPPSDPLDRLFEIVGLTRQAYEDDARFYRTIYASVYNTGGRTIEDAVSPPRTAFWQSAVDASARAGHFKPDTKLDLVGMAVRQIVRAEILDWVHDTVTPELMEARIAYGFCLVLSSVAVPEAAARLKVRMGNLEATIARLTAPPVKAMKKAG